MEPSVEWLSKFCFTPDYVRGAWGFKPFHVVLGGCEWTVTAERCIIIAVSGHLPGCQLGSTEAHRSVGHFLKPILTWQETVPLESLRRWCGPPEFTRECDCTDGCDQCDGHGEIFPKPRPGNLLGGIVERVGLACALERLEAEAVGVAWWQGKDAEGPVTIEPVRPTSHGQAAWRVVRTPMSLRQAEYDRTDLFGAAEIDPAWLAWNDGVVRKLAQAIRDGRRFADLPILGDALEDAGCQSRVLLDHCRTGAAHQSRCWVVDALLHGCA